MTQKHHPHHSSGGGLVSSRPKGSLITIALVALAAAAVGVYFVIRSFAASATTGVATFRTINTATGAGLDGGTVTINDSGWPETLCFIASGSSGSGTSTFGGGSANFSASGTNGGWVNATCAVSYSGNTSTISNQYSIVSYSPPSGYMLDTSRSSASGLFSICYNQNNCGGGAAGPVMTFYVKPIPVTPPPPPPVGPAPPPSGGGGAFKINSFTANPASIAYNGTSILSYALDTSVTACSIGNGTTAVLLPGSSSSWTTPNLTSTTSYTLTCTNGSSTSSASTKVTVAAQGQAPPPPPPGGTQGQLPITTTTGPKPVVPSSGGNPSDTQAPSTPTNLKARQNDSASVTVSWDPSTDNSGVVGYVVERSTDKVTWSKLTDSVKDTNYNDSTISFGTKYSYRVSAFDASGNVSTPAVTEIQTEAFSPNAFANSEAKINSDDGRVTVTIPAGALSEDAACTIVARDDIDLATPKGTSLVTGPYELVCKKKDGSTVDTYNKPVTFDVNLENPKSSLKYAIYNYDGTSWADAKVKYQSKAPNFSFSTDSPKVFAVLSSKQSSWLVWVYVVLLLLVIGGVIFWFIRRRSGGGDSGYDSYTASNYMTETMAAGPADQATPAAPTTPHFEAGARAGIADYQAPPAAQPGSVATPDAAPAPTAATNPANTPDVSQIVAPGDPNQPK